MAVSLLDIVVASWSLAALLAGAIVDSGLLWVAAGVLTLDAMAGGFRDDLGPFAGCA